MTFSLCKRSLGCDSELCAHTITGELFCRRGGLPSTDPCLDRAAHDASLPVRFHNAEVAVAYFKCQRPGLAARKMNPLEAVKLLQRSPGHPLVRQV